jgi:hypothetical protein
MSCLCAWLWAGNGQPIAHNVIRTGTYHACKVHSVRVKRGSIHSDCNDINELQCHKATPEHMRCLSACHLARCNYISRKMIPGLAPSGQVSGEYVDVGLSLRTYTSIGSGGCTWELQTMLSGKRKPITQSMMLHSHYVSSTPTSALISCQAIPDTMAPACFSCS